MRDHAARAPGCQARLALDHFGRRSGRVGDCAGRASREGPSASCSAPCRSQSGRSLAALNSLRRESSGTPRSSRALAMSVEKIMRASGDVVWRVRWRQHGRNRARTFSTRRDARDFDAEVRRQRQAGSLPALDAGAETFGEYVTETWAASHAATLAPKTRLHYASLYDYHLRPYLGLIARVRLRRRSSGVGRQTGWHRGRVPLRFGMRWICSGRFWNTHSWAGRSRRILPGASRRRGRLGGRRCNHFRPERSRRCAKRSTPATRRSSLSSRTRVFVRERRWACGGETSASRPCSSSGRPRSARSWTPRYGSTGPCGMAQFVEGGPRQDAQAGGEDPAG